MKAKYTAKQIKSIIKRVRIVEKQMKAGQRFLDSVDIGVGMEEDRFEDRLYALEQMIERTPSRKIYDRSKRERKEIAQYLKLLDTVTFKM